MNYMKTGLVKSSFVNLRVRQLQAETNYAFIEWCCLINGNKPTELFHRFDRGDICYKSQLYEDFTSEYPDFAPRAKMSLSKTEFNRWLVAYSSFKHQSEPKEGRDQTGRWIQIVKKNPTNLKLDL